MGAAYEGRNRYAGQHSCAVPARSSFLCFCSFLPGPWPPVTTAGCWKKSWSPPPNGPKVSRTCRSPISVVSGETIEKYQIVDLQVLQSYVPNLTVQRTFGNWAVRIRGLGSGVTNLAFDSSVSVFNDNIYCGRSRCLETAYMDPGRVEVARGPQGALYGKSTIAGALSVYSARPTDTFEGYVRGRLRARERRLVRDRRRVRSHQRSAARPPGRRIQGYGRLDDQSGRPRQRAGPGSLVSPRQPGMGRERQLPALPQGWKASTRR